VADVRLDGSFAVAFMEIDGKFILGGLLTALPQDAFIVVPLIEVVHAVFSPGVFEGYLPIVCIDGPSGLPAVLKIGKLIVNDPVVIPDQPAPSAVLVKFLNMVDALGIPGGKVVVIGHAFQRTAVKIGIRFRSDVARSQRAPEVIHGFQHSPVVAGDRVGILRGLVRLAGKHAVIILIGDGVFLVRRVIGIQELLVVIIFVHSGLSVILPEMLEFVPMLIAFIILWIVLAKFGWPMFNGMLEKRENTIREALKKSEEAQIESERTLAEYQKQLADAKAQAAALISEARETGDAVKAGITEKAHTEAADMIEKAKVTIEAEKKQTIAELQASIADTAVDVAARLIGEDLTEGEHRKIIERYVKEAGSFNAS